MALLFSFPGTKTLGEKLISLTHLTPGQFEIRPFPDGESYVRIDSDVHQEEVALLCSLNDPDQKALQIMFLSETLKELGARRVGLVAPYLGYMRQDTRFKGGEAITSKLFGQFLSNHIDWLTTVDPHLHRYKSLDEIYRIPTSLIHAAEEIANWMRRHVENPLLIGPDIESQQWVSEVAEKAGAPFLTLEKARHGDSIVEISFPDVEEFRDCTPVIIDDIISTASTMIETVKHLKHLKMPPPVCIGIHAIFSNGAFKTLRQAGAGKIITCNTIQHPSNEIDLSKSLAKTILRLIDA